jgi:hypothetical protein
MLVHRGRWLHLSLLTRFKPDALVADDTFTRRMKVAALDGVGRKKWGGFD